MLTSVCRPTSTLEAIHDILYESGGGATVVRDDTDEWSAFVAMNEQEAWLHLSTRFGAQTPPNQAPVPPQLPQVQLRPTASPPAQIPPHALPPTLLPAIQGTREPDLHPTTPDNNEGLESTPPEAETREEAGGCLPDTSMMTGDDGRAIRRRSKRQATTQAQLAKVAPYPRARPLRLRRRGRIEETEGGSDTDGVASIPDELQGRQRLWLHCARRWLQNSLQASSDHCAQRIPPARQEKMLARAEAIGSYTAQEEARELLAVWRRDGSPFASASVALSGALLTAPQEDRRALMAPYAQATTAFLAAWGAATAGRVWESVCAVVHRQRYADVWEAYKAVERATGEDRCDQQTSSGVTRRSPAKVALFHAIYPQYARIPDPQNDPTAKDEFRRFGRTLEHCSRWNLLRTRLGGWIFTLMPASKIPNSFIEQFLTVSQLEKWVELVMACNQTYRSRTVIEPVIDDFLRGRRAPRHRFVLEHSHRIQLIQCENMGALWARVDDGVNGGSRPSSRQSGGSLTSGFDQYIDVRCCATPLNGEGKV